MAANAPFTVVDDNAANHVFSPMGIDGGVASYQNLAEVITNGRETVRLAKKDGKSVREITIGLRMPNVVETTIDGVTRRVVEDFATGTTRFTVPPSWTSEQCETLRSAMAGTLAAAPVKACVDTDEFVW
jgi:hypothetical protein